MPRSLMFRIASLIEADAVVALVQRAYRGEESRAGWTTEAHLLDGQRTDRGQVESLVAGADTRLLLAYDGAALVGCVLVAVEAQGAYLGMLSVDPHCQARGIGRALLAEVERITRVERLGQRVRMRVIGQRLDLIAWYERRGYLRTGQREPFPYGEPRFGLPRRDDLYFEVMEKRLARAPR